MNEKHWTREFVAALWHNGGFESIAEMHNRQLEQLAFHMPNKPAGALHHFLRGSATQDETRAHKAIPAPLVRLVGET